MCCVCHLPGINVPPRLKSHDVEIGIIGVIVGPLQEAIVLGPLVEYLADIFLYQVALAYSTATRPQG
jgi:hypothetical protein